MIQKRGVKEGPARGGRRLEGKSAIVTGAARGIGKAIARRFVDEGATVVVSDVRDDLLEATRTELAGVAGGGAVASIVADVSDATQVHHLVRTSQHRLGRIDVLANNAGISTFNEFLTLAEPDWQRTLEVNLTGVFLCSQAVATIMREQGSGVIVNMASTNGLLGEARLAAYNASKAGVVLLTKTMAIELAPFGIRVNCVCPGFIETDMARDGGMSPELIERLAGKVPMGRRGRPEEVAAAFAFLSSDDASYITGTELIVDGGQLCQQP